MKIKYVIVPLGVLMLLAGGGSAFDLNEPQPPKGDATHPKGPPIIQHTPAIGGGQPYKPPVVQPQPVVKPVTPPTVIQHTPALAVPPKVPQHIEVPVVKVPAKVDVQHFVEQHKDKFVAPAGKVPAVKEVRQTPKIADKIGEKASQHVVTAYHKKLGDGPIKVGGKTIELKRRDDLAGNYQKHWQERVDGRYDRGREIRQELGHDHDHLFAPKWWDSYRDERTGWWGRWPGFATGWYDGFTERHHWGWWRPATWTAFAGWYAPTVWGQPLYYDYGGNVMFENNVVYVEGMPVASEEDYARQAMALAAVGVERLTNAPPAADRIEADWMPLGVFSLGSEAQGNPIMFLQLAVNKGGVIAGTYTNSVTNEALPVTGAIDPNTQRAAWYIGDNKDTVMETGAYNLTQSETQVLIHFGPDRTQTSLMVRLPEPEQQ